MISTPQNQLQRLFGDSVPRLSERGLERFDQAATDPVLQRTLKSLLTDENRASSVFDRLDRTVAREASNGNHGRSLNGHPEIPQTVADYEIIDHLSEGGMGIVYKARNVRLGRLVALKFLKPVLASDEQARARFIREAKAAGAIDHPHVERIYKIGTAEAGPLCSEGLPFFAMPYYPGETLKEKIGNGVLSLEDSVRFALQTASGLARAHDQDVWHRDIKPGNLIVTEEQRVKIIDFGIAKMAGASLTETGQTIGSPAYMSPEQARGEAVDGRTDVWSLGVVLFEMLTGQRPFSGEREVAVLYSVLHNDPIPPGSLRAHLPSELEAILHTCLQKDPSARYQDAGELRQALEDVVPNIVGS